MRGIFYLSVVGEDSRARSIYGNNGVKTCWLVLAVWYLSSIIAPSKQARMRWLSQIQGSIWVRFSQTVSMVGVAQLVELRIVIPVVAGSNPVAHPI